MLVIGNLILNGDFESWSSGSPMYWNSTSYVQMTENNDTVFHGSSSNRVYFNSTSLQIVSQGVSGIQEDSLYVFSFFVFDNDPAGRARVCVVWYGNGSYISGHYGEYSEDKPYWQILNSDTIRAPSGADSAAVQIRFYDVQDYWDGDAVIFIDRAVFNPPSTLTFNIVINEIMYNPSTDLGDDDDYEWIEVVNNGSDTADLTYWKLMDNYGVFNIPAIEIPPGEYLVIAKNMDSLQSVSEYQDDILNGNDQIVGNMTSLSLANDGDIVVLRTFDSVLVDSVPYEDSSPWPTEPDGSGPSAELVDPSYDNTNGANWLASSETYGTPGEDNGVHDPPPSIGKIWRAPYVPEAFQPDTFYAIITDNDTVELAMFYYWLSSHGFDSLQMGRVNGDTFMCILGGQARSVRLDSFFIKAVDNMDGVGVSDTSRGFFWGCMKIGELRINDAEGKPIYGGYEAIVQGVVTVGESTFAKTYLFFYIQDSTGGIGCHDYGETSIQPIHVGESLKVVGTITQFSGETELDYVGEWITKLGTGTVPTPESINVSEMGETYEGKLVMVMDIDTSFSSPWPSDVNTLDTIVDVNGDSGHIWIDCDTDIDGWGPDWTVNQHIVGILRQYDTSPPYDSGYEIVPRAQSDFISALHSMYINLSAFVSGNNATLIWVSHIDPLRFFIQEKIKGNWETIDNLPGECRMWEGEFSLGFHVLRVIADYGGYQVFSIPIKLQMVNSLLVDISFAMDNTVIINGSGKTIHVQIIDISGRVKHTLVIGKGMKGVIKFSSLPSGLYFLRVSGVHPIVKKFYVLKR